jgi:DNA-binding NarL/FixJ family response regulator
VKEDHPDRNGESIRILIADDHVLVRRGLRMLLDTEPGMMVVGEAGYGEQAFDLALQLQPGVILADITMPPPDGIALARELRTALPEAKTIIVSMHEDTATVKAAFAAGAFGYVIKRATEVQLVAAIHAAVAGQCYLDPELEQMMEAPRAQRSAL